MWLVGRYGGRNHVCNISWLSVKGCGGERSKFAFFHWLDVSPLQHCSPCDRVMCAMRCTVIIRSLMIDELEVQSVERMYLRQRCFDGSRWIKTILKPHVAAATDGQYVAYTWDFPDVIKFRVAAQCSAYTTSEKAIRFRHPDYNPDRALKLISSSISRHLSIRNISSKSMHAFLSNLTNRQSTGNNVYLLCRT